MKTFAFETSKWLLALAPVVALGACGGSGGSSDDGGSKCVGGKCDEVAPEDFACKTLVDQSGRGVPNVLEQLHDPLAEFALKRGGEGCPETFADVMARLRANDAEACSGGGNGMETRIVSETAPFESVASPQVRAVTTRTCNGRSSFELIFSIFGVSASRLPGGAEVMAFDPESGEFNYYETDGREMVFFGSSSDFVQGRGGRCKGCHTAGGLVMKELRNPWMHWERHDRASGPILDAHKDDLGSSKFSRGSSMESLTVQGNRKWNETKVLLMNNPDNGMTPADMLRPLFCGAQVNLDTAATSSGSEPTRIPEGFFAHCKLFGSGTGCSNTHFGESGGVSIAAGTYNAAIASAGQILPDVPGATDTVFAMPFIEPAAEDIDYIDKLVAAGVIDDDFVVDVLAVDFTRPVFSKDRCDLLAFAPSWADLDGPVDPVPTDDGMAEGGTTDDGGTGDGGTGDGGTGDGGTDGAVDGGADAGDSAGDSGTCCEAHDTSGCSNATIQECVCAFDEFCCASNWDSTCVEEASTECNAMCVAPREAKLSDPALLREATADTVRAGFIARLEDANPDPGSPAGQLLASLQAADDAANHRARVTAFVAACNDRDDAAFMADALQVVHNQRRTAAGLDVFEFAATMPDIDSSPMSGAHLDPATCELVTD